MLNLEKSFYGFQQQTLTVSQKHKVNENKNIETLARERMCVCFQKDQKKSEFIAALSGKAPKSALAWITRGYMSALVSMITSLTKQKSWCGCPTQPITGSGRVGH